jgi:hypothetical protein
MAQPPIQYFRKEDFPEIASEGWAQRLFSKLNGMARQTQLGMDANLSVSQNLAAFWWDGIIGAYQKAEGIIYPYSDATLPDIPNKGATAINAFPFYFANKIVPKVIKGVFVAQAFDVTDTTKQSLPAMCSGVAWDVEGDRVKIYGIDGMVIGRAYRTRLLLMSE